jgi:hypothetical protein
MLSVTHHRQNPLGSSMIKYFILIIIYLSDLRKEMTAFHL